MYKEDSSVFKLTHEESENVNNGISKLNLGSKGLIMKDNATIVCDYYSLPSFRKCLQSLSKLYFYFFKDILMSCMHVFVHVSITVIQRIDI